MYNKLGLLYIVHIIKIKGKFMNDVDHQTALNKLLTEHKKEFAKAPFPSYQHRIYWEQIARICLPM